MIFKHISVYIFLAFIFITLLNGKVVIEDGENGVDKWKIIVGKEGDIIDIFDEELNSSVIEFLGGGSYKLGATVGDRALNIKDNRFISWQMKAKIPYTIYIITNTKEGIRYLFYVSTPSRALNHGLEYGIHHGLGEATIANRWMNITRDLQRDIKDAEPNNDLISVNGFIFNGGDGTRIDNITIYNPKEITYLSEAKKVSQVEIIDINNSKFKILQWSFKDFGTAKILETRGTIENPKVFEFRVGVETEFGDRDLVYTLGLKNLGFIDDTTIHHALGDDRTIGSVWKEDSSKNILGLWQGITRDLEEDIKDFERDNILKKVKYLKITGDGYIKDVKMFSSVDMDISDINSSTTTLDSNYSSSNTTSTCRSLNNGVGLNIGLVVGLAFTYLILFLFHIRRLMWVK